MIDKIFSSIGALMIMFGFFGVSGCIEFGTGWIRVLAIICIGSIILAFESWRCGGLDRV